MSLEQELKKEERLKPAFLQCLIHQDFPACPDGDLFFVTQGIDEKPETHLVLKEDAIIERRSRLHDRFGYFNFGYVWVEELLDWRKLKKDIAVINLPGVRFPAIVDSKLVVIDPRIDRLFSFRLLEKWAFEYQKEIEEYEMAYLATAFGSEFIPKGKLESDYG